MGAILKIRLPFFRRKTLGNASGLATFYLGDTPNYLPQVNQSIIITHTQVPANSGLKTKLNSVSTNTVLAKFQSLEENTTQESVEQTDGYSVFLIAQYEDVTFSTSQFSGDCQGYIEYDVNPANYSILKPVESAVIVSEVVPYDSNDGINTVENVLPVGDTNFMKGMFVKRTDNNTIFANLLKSLNLPVSDAEMKKYTRSALGTLTQTTNPSYDVTIDGLNYVWTEHTSTGATTNSLVVHPTDGWVGEYYGTVLQTIGSYEFTPTNKAITPIQNDLFLIFEIPNGSYGEIIDGKSIKMRLPFRAITSYVDNTDAKLGIGIYGGSLTQLELYGTYNKKNLNTTNLDNVLSEIDLSMKDIGIRPNLNQTSYESNVVLLFSDSIKEPQNVNLTSWSDGYTDLLDGSRVFNPNNTEKALYDYAQDQCVGFVALDKGFVVITHPLLVDYYFSQVFGGEITKTGTTIYNTNKNYNVNNVESASVVKSGYDGSVETNAIKMLTTIDDSDYIVWDSSQFTVYSLDDPEIVSDIKFMSYNTEKSLNIVCLASSDEFFKSTNDTAKEFLNVADNEDYASFKSENKNLYPVIVTQLGIHDANGDLLAIAKPNKPSKKFWYDVVSFNVRIRL